MQVPQPRSDMIIGKATTSWPMYTTTSTNNGTKANEQLSDLTPRMPQSVVLESVLSRSESLKISKSPTLWNSAVTAK
jgi:hypothetical protein